MTPVNISKNKLKTTAQMKRILIRGYTNPIDYFGRMPGILQEYDELVFSSVGLSLLKINLKKDKVVAIDIETTGLDPTDSELVLSTWYFPLSDTLYTIVHITSIFKYKINYDFSTYVFFRELSVFFKDCLMISHNAGFEYKWLRAYGLCRPREIFCTMVADQKITQGMADFRYDLVSTLNRRRIKHKIVKNVTLDFTAMTDVTHIELKHLVYSKDDTIPLYNLYKHQDFLIRTLQQEFWIKRIHMPLAMILVDMEVEGLIVDNPKFLGLADEAEKKLEDLDIKLHDWVTNYLTKSMFHGKTLIGLVPSIEEKFNSYNKRLATAKGRIKINKKLLDKWQQKGKTHLKAYKTTVGVLTRAINQYQDLKSNPPQIKINWGSSDQVLELMSALKISLPMGKSTTTHKFQPSLSKAARQNWLIDNPLVSPKRDFMLLLDEYAGLTKYVNSFGRSFLEKYYRPKTDKVHTSYKQGTVATGRLASGSANSTPPTFNSQQLPAIKELRECFGTDPGYFIVTCDLSGAELITMCSLAQDHKLLALSKGDMHSYFANKGWAAIYKSRGKVWTEVIDKKHPLRLPYKSMTFGTVYGLKAPKAGETLNVNKHEGQIAIDTIVDEIPDTITMVEKASEDALRQGWVLHNTRTNSRRWFKPVLDLNKENLNYKPENRRTLNRRDSLIIAQAARNSRIQGTQGDMLCEAMVVLDRFIRFHKLDAKILLQVHDELVVKFHKDLVSWFPDRVKEIMTRTANKYLENVTMEADYHVGLTWTK